MLMTKRIVTSVLTLTFIVSTCGMALEFPKIDRKPAPDLWDRGRRTSVPHLDPAAQNPFAVDLRSYDVSNLDLKKSLLDLLQSSFDDRTKWPPMAQMPDDFDPRQIMILGRNPGLGVRALHQQGITGRGVGVAILDQPLIVDHQEYGDRLRLYEEINILNGMPAQMHGPAVTSLAVGKTVGVAPRADLYCVAVFNGDANEGRFTWNFEYLARAVERVLEINQQLPPAKKIRVISMSVGWERSQKGYAQITQAVQKAKAAGLLVICSSVEEVHGFAFQGLGRPLTANPDDFNVYQPGAFWAKEFYRRPQTHSRLLVPMDARTTAGPTSAGEYAFYAQGGWSWAIPYIAGMYALAAQVEPKITPERFWALAMRTGRTIKVIHEDKTFDLGPILDPAQLVDAIKRGDLSDQAAVTAELAKYRVQSQGLESQDRIPADLAARIAKLDLDHATRKDVIEQMGAPVSYVLGTKTLDPGNLPSRYAMIYPAGVQVVIIADRVARVVFSLPGYLFRDKIEVGTPLEDVLKILGLPDKTIENAHSNDVAKAPLEDGVFYRDIDGVAGNGLYQARSQGVSLYFMDNHVRQMTLVPKNQ